MVKKSRGTIKSSIKYSKAPQNRAQTISHTGSQKGERTSVRQDLQFALEDSYRNACPNLTMWESLTYVNSFNPPNNFMSEITIMISILQIREDLIDN